MSISKNKTWFLASTWCSLFLAILFIVSLRFDFGYAGSTALGGLSSGAAVVGVVYGTPRRKGWICNTNLGWEYRRKLIWLPSLRSDSGGTVLVVPFWIPFVVGVVVWALSARRFRTGLIGHCRKCVYDLTGNVSGVCPECGQKVQRT